ncbi:uncharacterized protein LOC129303453 isoform X3 [Prosopis cineraria]|uniref:uncharacterized protein LOC129303453 isoform X3 n=1 Tax=Prosopis cineraria TaxID=364024 RepID=UPI00241085F8|nr:uncharacterized protein LOC129303453 isoform X3 [Prosopis cineraria]
MKLWEEMLLFILMFSGDFFRAFVLSIVEKLEFIFKRPFRSRGCIGYSTIPRANTLMDGASEVQTVKEDKRSEDLSSSCTFEMDQSAAQSIGTPNLPSVPQTSADPQSDHIDFVNRGLLLWNQMREQWIQKGRSERRPQVGEPRISEDDTYDSLLGSNEPFPQPIPLGDMVDFLVDVWDQEGLYD